MATTLRTDERSAALRFCLVALGWLVCLFGWACLLSFHVADPPATVIWQHSTDVRNLCGPLGAWLAYHAFELFGVAAYPMMALLHGAVLAAGRPGRLNDLWLRFFGTLLVLASSAALGRVFLTPTDRWTLDGPGGILGQATAGLLLPYLDQFGTVLILALVLLVGLLLAADNLVMAVLRGLRWAGTQSGPVLVRGGTAVAGAGAAVVQTVAHTLTTREDAPRTHVRPAGVRVLKNVQRGRGDAAGPSPSRRDHATVEPPHGRRPAAVPEPEEADEEDDPAALAEEEEEFEETDEEVVDEESEEEVEEATDGEEEEDDVPAAPPAPRIREPVGVKDLRPVAVPRSKPLPERRTADDSDYHLPAMALLERPIPLDRSLIEQSCREKAFVLEQTLNEFRLEVEVVSIQTGPVITVFELKLAPGIKVSQIQSLSNDMARALKAPAVRVVAPLPGRNTIGIEVPNLDKEKVRLREVMELSGARLEQCEIPLFLGKDPAGQPLLADLTRMPHLLIAGTTGSGKSVCVTSLIMSILMTRTPAQVQLILVDPKVVELSIYKDVPHLMCPIVTEVSKAEGILEWAATKMDERYALLAEAGVKDIKSYNRLGPAGLKERLGIEDETELAKIPVKLPYMVIMIDELADLMMMSPKEVEFYLCRIAQKSRAVGIHLIVSTQRPQANVVTGLIKSNLPCRIAFRVSSRLDSRIVLDQNGGELLLGQGDMLFLPPGSSKLVRSQGTFVDDDELRAVVKHCKGQGGPRFDPELVRIPSAGGGGAGSATERDDLFDEAVTLIIEAGRGSVSLLQRKLTIGYGRASRLIDQMYESGIVGEYKGSQAREVVVSMEEWEQIRAQRDREESAAEGD
ncbi:MAG: DNA translocase FtsK 4TM domain-containing protein [Phycisphaerales bacterium]|nr:DNA translocase FtsK 4TM domain-containing protein [Phycisphaerales bacterium]